MKASQPAMASQPDLINARFPNPKLSILTQFKKFEKRETRDYTFWLVAEEQPSAEGEKTARREIGSMRFNPKEIQSEISPPRREGGTRGRKDGEGRGNFFLP